MFIYIEFHISDEHYEIPPQSPWIYLAVFTYLILWLTGFQRNSSFLTVFPFLPFCTTKSQHSGINILQSSPVGWGCSLPPGITHSPRRNPERNPLEEPSQEGSAKPAKPSSWGITWQAVALEGEVAGLVAGAPVHAGGRGAGHVDALAAMPCVPRLALAPVGAGQVDTGATVLAQARCGTFIHIYLTLLASVASQAGAGELISRHGACTPVGTRLRRAGIDPLAFLSFRKSRQINKIINLIKNISVEKSLPQFLLN